MLFQIKCRCSPAVAVAAVAMFDVDGKIMAYTRKLIRSQSVGARGAVLGARSQHSSNRPETVWPTLLTGAGIVKKGRNTQLGSECELGAVEGQIAMAGRNYRSSKSE